MNPGQHFLRNIYETFRKQKQSKRRLNASPQQACAPSLKSIELLEDRTLLTGIVTTEIDSAPSTIVEGELVDITVRIKFEDNDQGAPWQVTKLSLYDKDLVDDDLIATVSNPLEIHVLGNWSYFTFENVDLSNSDWNDDSDGVELYAFGEIDDNSFNFFNPDDESPVTQVTVVEPAVTGLSFTDSLGNPINNINAGETVFIRADAVGMAGETINIQIWEDDGIGDDLITTKSVTIGSSGFGIATWIASWQSDDGDDPFNEYYLFYDKPFSLNNTFSGNPDEGHFQVFPTPWSGNSNSFSTLLSRDWETLPSDESSVILKRYGGGNIDSSKNTWIVIHGWMDSFQPGGSMYDLANEVYRNANLLGMQVLTLDWSEAASQSIAVENWIPVVSEWTKAALQTVGFSSTTSINLIGHSYGAVISGELAQRLGGVNKIIALDPANNNVLGGGSYDTESINFAENSTNSWAFLTSLYGSGDSTTTADASFMVDIVGDFWGTPFDSSHSHAKNLYTEILKRNTNGTAGRFSQFFGLNRILTNSSPWTNDIIVGYSGSGAATFPETYLNDDFSPLPKYEAVLRFQENNDTLTPISFEYVDLIGQRKIILEQELYLSSDGTLFASGNNLSVKAEIDGFIKIIVDNITKTFRTISTNPSEGFVKRIVAEGTTGDDVLNFSESPVPVTFAAYGGNDTIIGSEFNDIIFAGAGNDNIKSMGGYDEIFGESGNNTIDSGDGDDVVHDSGNGDQVTLGNGTDYVHTDFPQNVLDATVSDYVVGLEARVEQRRLKRLSDREKELANQVGQTQTVVVPDLAQPAPGFAEFSISETVLTEGESTVVTVRSDRSGSWARLELFADINHDGVYTRGTDFKILKTRGRTDDWRAQIRTSLLGEGTYDVRAMFLSYDGSITVSSAISLTIEPEPGVPDPPELPAHLDIDPTEPILIIPHENGDVAIPNNDIEGAGQIDLWELNPGTSGNFGFNTIGMQTVKALYDSNGNRIGEPQGGGQLTVSLTGGNKYYIAIASRFLESGTYDFNVTGTNQILDGQFHTVAASYTDTLNGIFDATNRVDYWEAHAPDTATFLDVSVDGDPGLNLWIRVADDNDEVIGFADLSNPGTRNYLTSLPVEGGQNYYITVHGLYGADGNYSVTADFSPDTLGFPDTLNPQLIPEYGEIFIQADGDAVVENQSIVSAGELKYFLITPNSSQEFLIRTTGTTDTQLAIYTGNGSQLLAESDNDADGSNGQVQIELTGGEDYWIVVRGKDDVTGVFGLEVAGPAQITEPLSIGGLGNLGSHTFGISNNSRQHYFSFIAPEGTTSADLRLEVLNPHVMDTIWSIEDSSGNMTFVDIASDNAVEVLSSFQVTGGEEYLISIYGKSMSTGSGQFFIDLAPDNDLTGEFNANTSTFNDQWLPSIAMNSTGRSVIVWTSSPPSQATGDDLDNDLYFQIFDENNQPVGSETKINQADGQVDQYDVKVGMTSNGNFVTAWVQPQESGPSKIYLRLFNFAGTPITNEFDAGFAEASIPNIAVNPDGTFAVILRASDQILVRTFNANGSPASSVNVLDSSDDDLLSPDITPNGTGGYIATWVRENSSSQYHIVGNVLNQAGSLTAQSIAIDHVTNAKFGPSVSANSSGEFVVGYYQFDSDGSGQNIYFQIFNSDATAKSNVIQANTYTPDVQEEPHVYLKENGEVIVVWTSSNQEGSGKEVYLRHFHANGTPVNAEEIRLNDFTTGDQERISIAGTGLDRVGVVWESDNQDSSGDSVVAKFLNLPGPAPAPAIVISEDSGTENDNQVEFDSHNQNAASPQESIRITNTGTADLTGFVSFTGDGASQYSFNESASFDLSPGEFIDYSLMLVTNALGTFPAQFVITHNTGEGSSTVELTGSILPQLDASESNNDPQSASDLGILGNAVLNNLTIHDVGDVDWFQFEVNQFSLIEISALFSHQEGDLDMTLYDQNLGVVASAASVTDNELISDFIMGGQTYYLKVYSNGLSSNVYQLSLTATDSNPSATLDEISDVIINQNDSEQTVNLTGIAASGTGTNPLRVTATSSNTSLIPDPVVNYISTDVSGSLTFIPVANQSGTATITVTVEDGGLDGDLNTTGDNSIIQRTFDVTVTTLVDIDLRVVSSPTVSDSNGEVSQLPENQDWVSEWSTFWVEIWVTTESPSSQGIVSVNLNLNYLTQYTSATTIQYGAGFDLNQAGTIDDSTGRVESLYAEASTTGLGIFDSLLFARIKFESLADDGVDLDTINKLIGPYDLGLSISSQQVALVSDNLLSTNLNLPDSTRIWANPYDLNDDDKITYRDLILLAGVYGTIPSESDSDYAWAADLDQSDKVNYRDLISFVGNYGKSKANDPDVNYLMNYPDAWDNSLVVASQPPSPKSIDQLKQSAAEGILEQAIVSVSESLSAGEISKLENVTIQVVDLNGGTLGRVASDTIYIDINAAGYGWFIDETPLDHSEFRYDSKLSLIALPGSEAEGLIDLWTVIRHELGHFLGYKHEENGVMEATLDLGVRNLPDWNADADDFFASVKDELELLLF
ncbi:hypothetical protein [Gimesia maris]|uniref:hypothetical protein n=1 Tax=Gimesia maris TaxID=122 RepID=UPI003A91190F